MRYFIIAALICGKVFAAEAAAQPATVNSGRFVFSQYGSDLLSKFMVDTETGRLWVFAINPTTNKMTLVPIHYQATDGGYSILPLEVAEEVDRANRGIAAKRIKDIDGFLKWAADHRSGYQGKGAPNDPSWTAEQIAAKVQELTAERQEILASPQKP